MITASLLKAEVYPMLTSTPLNATGPLFFAFSNGMATLPAPFPYAHCDIDLSQVSQKVAAYPLYRRHERAALERAAIAFQ
jgi:hypothetical protein